MENILQWNKEFSELAYSEGWNFYYSQGSAYGDYQIQRNDEQGLLEQDEDAWKLVANGTEKHHELARQLIKNLNPQEYERVMKLKIK